MNIDYCREKLDRGVHVNIIRNNKFKSNLISFYIIRPLKREEVTKNALLPLVLRRGTGNYNSSLDIERKLEELYGSDLSIGVTKKGEKQIIRISIEGVENKYADGINILKQKIELLNEIINNPLIENGKFVDKYVELEKRNLSERIKGRINDKKQYAIDRCIESMCKEENFKIYKYGYEEDLKEIGSKILFDHYKKILKTSPIEICVVGNIDKEEILKYLTELIKEKRIDTEEIQRENIDIDVIEEKEVIDEMDINQGKLCIGYRTKVPYESNLYEAFLIANHILGGGPDSKLFLNVREKESLAYYIYARSYKYKSIMIIASGIEFDKYDQSVKIIKEQVSEMLNGNFTDKDIEQSKKSIITSLKTILDDNFSISEFYLNKAITAEEKNIEDIINNINNVKKEDIIRSLQNLKLDTVYFLKGNK